MSDMQISHELSFQQRFNGSNKVIVLYSVRKHSRGLLDNVSVCESFQAPDNVEKTLNLYTQYVSTIGSVAKA